jgi:hypothetical protein
MRVVERRKGGRKTPGVERGMDSFDEEKMSKMVEKSSLIY